MREHKAAGIFPRPALGETLQGNCYWQCHESKPQQKSLRSQRVHPFTSSSKRASASWERQKHSTWQQKQRLHKSTAEILICFGCAELWKLAGGPVGLPGDARRSWNRLSGTLGERRQKSLRIIQKCAVDQYKTVRSGRKLKNGVPCFLLQTTKLTSLLSFPSSGFCCVILLFVPSVSHFTA